MQLIEISEPGSIKPADDIVVGIDFGTTNSLIALSKDYRSFIVKMSDGGELVPSVVYIEGKKLTLKPMVDNNRSIRSIKRLLAKSSEEIRNNQNLNILSKEIDLTDRFPKLKIDDKELTLIEVASEIFKYLKCNAEKNLGEIKKAVVSVPAYFDDNARGQVILAAKLAGIQVQRLIAEPTAAAYAYGLNKLQSGVYLVYDFGGGTFDVSILNMQTGVMQVVATGGDSMLGGDDIDFALAEYVAKKLGLSLSDELIFIVKKLKEELSTKEYVSYTHAGQSLEIHINEFNNIIRPIIKQTIDITKNTINDSGMSSFDGIILVGGSTRMSLVSKMLKETFNLPIHNDIDPDKVVAFGAAMQAENLVKKSNSLLLDVTPLSLGIEIYGGVAEKIILRNTPIPFSVSREFTTHVDNQQGMIFHVIQGEREFAKDCRSLAKFELKGIEPKKAGITKIEVTFSIDADGILSVNARDYGKGIFHEIEVKPSYGLELTQVNELLKIAFDNAQNDHDQRLLLESKEQGKSLISGLIKAISETPKILSEKEKNKITNAIVTLENALALDDREDIIRKTDNLNRFAATFIQRHLDLGAELFLKGKNIKDVGSKNGDREN
jgi:molecular chaperone HscA